MRPPPPLAPIPPPPPRLVRLPCRLCESAPRPGGGGASDRGGAPGSTRGEGHPRGEGGGGPAGEGRSGATRSRSAAAESARDWIRRRASPSPPARSTAAASSSPSSPRTTSPRPPPARPPRPPHQRVGGRPNPRATNPSGPARRFSSGPVRRLLSVARRDGVVGSERHRRAPPPPPPGSSPVCRLQRHTTARRRPRACRLRRLGQPLIRRRLAVIGLQRQISTVAKTKDLKNHKWRDLQVADWRVVEKITEPMHTDGSFCGLFMINYMEYWTGTQLSDNVTEDDMKNFRLKLIAILWDSELNTRKACPDSEPDDNKKEKSDSEVEILDKPPNVLIKKKNSDIVSISNTLVGEEELLPAIYSYIKSFRQKLCAVMRETKTHALSIRSMPMGEQELRDEICNYIMSIHHDEALKKEWVLSSKPYPIALSAKKIQGILRKDQAMDVDCFNLVVRSLAFEELQSLKRSNKTVSKHYMDLKFSIRPNRSDNKGAQPLETKQRNIKRRPKLPDFAVGK
ncbi:hypothetical protein U9M48_025178 [Paspalum notatum var. saurae]|uniref:Ubiquitin-like protease family profile domain-containing protein n=1 Tax=Paspalum notatum var. saurae TaxID=547442 RepID=A0AAQ3TPK4_PASNO